MLIKLKEKYREEIGDGLSDRAFDLYIYDLILQGKIYDVLEYPFYQEYQGSENSVYIPLQQRRPSVKVNICKKVVDDSVSLLFSEGHFPKIHTADKDTRDALQLVAKHKKLNEVMIEAAFWGSIGSVAIWVGVLDKELFFRPMKSVYLTPEFDNEMNQNLVSVTEKYQVSGADLVLAGYPVADKDLEEPHWFMRIWNATEEVTYKPWKVSDESKEDFKLTIDNVTKHNLGFVPIVWIKNLPGGDLVDGQCSFSDGIDLMIENDYQLSQCGRGLRYSADPTLLIKAEGGLATDDEIVKSSDRALVVGEDGDAKLLEIAGSAAAAVDKHVRNLREFALEVMHGNRVNTDKLSVAQSGKAMEMMNQDLIWLSDKLRTTYGEGGLISLLKMTLKILAKNKISINDKPLPPVNPNEEITLVWNPWYSYTPDDMQKMAVALGVLTEKGLLSRETAVRSLQHEFDFEDVDMELKQIDSDVKVQDQGGSTSGKSNVDNKLEGTLNV